MDHIRQNISIVQSTPDEQRVNLELLTNDINGKEKEIDYLMEV